MLCLPQLCSILSFETLFLTEPGPGLWEPPMSASQVLGLHFHGAMLCIFVGYDLGDKLLTESSLLLCSVFLGSIMRLQS